MIKKIDPLHKQIILGDNYISYPSALEMTGLDTLYARREARCLNFALKTLKHPVLSEMFPKNRNTTNGNTEIRNREPFQVNFARTEQYKKSAIPFCQRLLNKHFNLKQPQS